MPPKHVIIVGGGLAGPALALALARQSVKSTLLERQPSVQDIGGVIMLAPNAMAVMESTLGIADKVQQHGSPFDIINAFVERADDLEFVEGFNQRTPERSAISIPRPVLHHTLVDECKKFKDLVDIRFSSRVESIQEDEQEVFAVLENGSTVKGDILIGADGIRSRVRQHILREVITPTYSGVLNIGAILPRSLVTLPPGMRFPAFCYTRYGTFLSFAMNEDKLQWATSLKVPERDRKSWEVYRTSGEAVADLKARYSDMQLEPIQSLVANLNNDNVRLWAPYLMPDIKTWHSSRVCILGDAAHAIPPSAGQGAAQAFEDVGLMARLLLKDGIMDYQALFAQFESMRRPRIDLIRDLTISAESVRREKTLEELETAKAGSLLGGAGGSLKNDSVVTYDVTRVAI